MRHMNSGRKLGMDSSERTAMFRNMVTSLLLHERIKTTEARAKEVRRIAERVITFSKRANAISLEGLEGEQLQQARARKVHYVRLARRWVTDRQVLERLFNEYGERFKDRQGGYTRLYKVGIRPGDNTPMNLVELLPAGESRAAEGTEGQQA